MDEITTEKKITTIGIEYRPYEKASQRSRTTYIDILSIGFLASIDFIKILYFIIRNSLNSLFYTRQKKNISGQVALVGNIQCIFH